MWAIARQWLSLKKSHVQTKDSAVPRCPEVLVSWLRLGPLAAPDHSLILFLAA